MIKRLLLLITFVLSFGLNSYGNEIHTPTLEESLEWLKYRGVTYSEPDYEVDFGPDAIDESELIYLSVLPHLKLLNIDHITNITGEGFVYLLKFQHELEILEINDCMLSTKASEIIATFTKLKLLTILYSRDTILPILDSNPIQASLKNLSVSGNNIDEWILSQIGKKFQLERFQIFNSSIGYEEMEDGLDSFESLETISLRELNLGDNAVIELTDTFSNLKIKNIDFRCNSLSDASVWSILKIESLKKIAIGTNPRECPDIENVLSKKAYNLIKDAGIIEVLFL